MEPPEKRSRPEPLDISHKKPSVYENTNGVPRTSFPPKVLHLGLADGELANRVVTVGHPARAELLAKFLKPEQAGGSIFRLASDRGFVTYTGSFFGKRISICATGMGLAMMDFFVREGRSVVQGPMAVVRLGTCGCLQAPVPVGSVCVATEGSILLQRSHAGDSSYAMSPPCLPDAPLSAAVLSELKKSMGEGLAHGGLNVTADSFYSSQGRLDSNFADDNATLIDDVVQSHPSAVTMEMETFQLLHLAHICVPNGSLRAASAVVVVANRPSGEVVSDEKLLTAEREGGLAILRALVNLQLDRPLV